MLATALETWKDLKAEKHSALNFKRILAPIDFSPASNNACKDAVHLAEKFGAELTLLYVLEPAPSAGFATIPGAAPFSENELSSAEKNLGWFIASTGGRNIKRPHWKIRVGVPCHEIVEAAKEDDVDLIVIATHGHKGWKHFCIGSTAERVVRAAPCPVLVVREKEHQFR